MEKLLKSFSLTLVAKLMHTFCMHILRNCDSIIICLITSSQCTIVFSMSCKKWNFSCIIVLYISELKDNRKEKSVTCLKLSDKHIIPYGQIRFKLMELNYIDSVEINTISYKALYVCEIVI